MTDNSKKFEYWVDYDNDGTLNWRNAKTLNRYRELCDRKRRADLCFFSAHKARHVPPEADTVRVQNAL